MKLFSKKRRKKKQKFYGSKHWRKRSLLYRKNHPLCVRCLELGRYRIAKVADHDNPEWKGKEGLTNKLNALCLSCHREKTFSEDIPKLRITEKTAFNFF